MATSILVTGGTGTLGSLVVPRLRAAGRDVRVLTRHRRDPEDGIEYVACDLSTGIGLTDALAGCSTVLHLAGDARHDEATTRALTAAAAAAGVSHLVYISVTAADRIPIGYYRGKAAGERLVASSGVPWTTLRAAQFHDLALGFLTAVAKSPVLPVPIGMRWQPVEVAEVAERLVALALAEPAGLAPSIVGPEVLSMADLARTYLAAAGKHRVRLPLPLPGKIGRTYRAGENLELDATGGTRTWAEFLAERFGR